MTAAPCSAIMQLTILSAQAKMGEGVSLSLPSSPLASGSDSCTRKETHVAIMDTFVLVVAPTKIEEREREREEMNGAKSCAKDLIMKWSLL